jgi:hypothetical protein
MNWATLLGNVASGGILGLVGQLATGWMHLKEKAVHNAHELAMIDAQKGLAVETASASAFAASQQAETATAANVSPWAANIKTLWRPALTLLLLILTACIYFSSSPESRSEIAGNIVTATTGCIFWWFGSRYQAALRNK